jgi:hypothetical protein
LTLELAEDGFLEFLLKHARRLHADGVAPPERAAAYPNIDRAVIEKLRKDKQPVAQLFVPILGQFSKVTRSTWPWKRVRYVIIRAS